METITLADYIQYGFLAFIGLLLIAMFVALMRLSHDNGEIKGLILSLRQRVDLVMRHRHDQDNGQVVLTPEEVAAD